MKTKTIGELLVSERLKRDLTIEHVAELTKISVQHIHALEHNHFEQMPAATFVKGFIKSLANCYQLDPQPLLAMLRRDFKESAGDRLVPHEFLRPALKHQRMWTPVITTMVCLGAVFFTLISYVLFQWYSLQKPPELNVIQPAELQELTSPIRIQGNTLPDTIVTVNAQPIGVFPDGTFETEIALPRQGTHLLTIEATDRKGKKSVVQRIVRVKL